MTQIKTQAIRNRHIRRDFKRLLELVASPHEPDFDELAEIAERNGLGYDEQGDVIEVIRT